VNAPGIHYNIVGTGRAVMGDREPVPLMPHTLIVLPPNSPFRIEVEGSNGFSGLRSIKGKPRTPLSGMRRVAGDGDPRSCWCADTSTRLMAPPQTSSAV
jgi:AraC family transcriptional activator of mtrCDE